MKYFLLTLAIMLPALSTGQTLNPLNGALKLAWPKNHTVNIVFHGHSVPAGFQKTPEVKPFEAYPHLVHRKIKELYPYAVLNVITTAIGGENSVSGAARFEKDVLPHRPDLILVDYALNDRALSLEKVEAAWMTMIRDAKQAGIPLVLITPTGDKTADLTNPTDPLTQRADLIRKLAAREKVILADVSALWIAELAKGTVQTELLSQANHPNLRGHEIAADAIFKSLQEAGLKP
jgi:lysophospholipase L1-like esterase